MSEEQVDFDVEVFYDAIRYNKWDVAKAFVDENHPNALYATLNSRGETALHVAARFGHESIAEELVKLAPPQYLEKGDAFGFPPLAIAAQYGGDSMIRVVECMVNKNSNILAIPVNRCILPVTWAFLFGQNEMGRCLYSCMLAKDPLLECLKPQNGDLGHMLVRSCLLARELDVALDLLQRCQELFLSKARSGWTPMAGIASMPYIFPSRTKLVFWKRWIYDYINIQSTTSTNFVRVDIQQQGQSIKVQGLGLMQRIISHTCNLSGLKEICEEKRMHAQAAQILRLICNNVTAIDRNLNQQNIVANALFHAAEEGNVEFVAEVMKANPSTVLRFDDSSYRHLFFYAVEYRQAEVFNLIHDMCFKNTLASTQRLQSGSTMLHEAGMLAPSSRLNRISGAALQMQSELQWFKAVESVVPPGFKEQKNNDGKKAEDLFKESHKELRKEGEQWMKDTSTSCSVVGALVITIMFAAAFTVPGGNDQNSGYPIFLQDKLFLLFIISDALSLFSSTTSVLMFLGILTSRYAEEDFLVSLPRKLIIGLFTLFFSIATMMITFSACILIMLQHRYPWSPLPVIIFASIPVTLFALLQFPLLVQMVSSTYCPGIFNRNVKPGHEMGYEGY